MARIRKFVCYRNLERPYTRYSKYKNKSYVRSKPVCRITKFEMGETGKQYDCAVHLIAKDHLQIRDNSIESARLTINRPLEKVLGKTGYEFLVRAYPHHVLRENPLAAGAGADRLSTGMAHSFGKTIGIAAQIKKGKILFTIFVNKNNLELAKSSLKKGMYKLPCSCKVEVEKLK